MFKFLKNNIDFMLLVYYTKYLVLLALTILLNTIPYKPNIQSLNTIFLEHYYSPLMHELLIYLPN